MMGCWSSDGKDGGITQKQLCFSADVIWNKSENYLVQRVPHGRSMGLERQTLELQPGAQDYNERFVAECESVWTSVRRGFTLS